jgi:hypothetical protein
MKTTMTNAAIQEAHNDRVLLHYIWNNRALGDNEWVRMCALDAFCESLADDPVESRQRTFLLAIDFLQELIDLDTEIDRRVEEKRDAARAQMSIHGHTLYPELDAEYATAQAAIGRLDLVYNSVLEYGYFDADPLTAEQFKQQLGDYCYSCDCRCTACAQSHAASPRAFLWPAMCQEHQLRCERSAKSGGSTLDAGEEVADIIGGSII